MIETSTCAVGAVGRRAARIVGIRAAPLPPRALSTASPVVRGPWGSAGVPPSTWAGLCHDGTSFANAKAVPPKSHRRPGPERARAAGCRAAWVVGWAVLAAVVRAAAVRAAFAFAAAADAFAAVAPTPLMSLVSSAYRPTANATASDSEWRGCIGNHWVVDRTARTVPVRAARWGVVVQAVVGAGGTGGTVGVCPTVSSDGIRIQSRG